MRNGPDSFLVLVFIQMDMKMEMTAPAEVLTEKEVMLSMKVEMWLHNVACADSKDPHSTPCDIFQEELQLPYGADLEVNESGNISNCFNLPTQDVIRENPVSISQSVHRKLTLIRGSYFSLVELPTFLTSPVELGGLNCTVSSTSSTTFSPDHGMTLSETLASYKFKTNRDLGLNKRSQWSVMFAALVFFLSCLILVGTMLSFTSEYQDRAIAKVINISNSKFDSGLIEMSPNISNMT